MVHWRMLLQWFRVTRGIILMPLALVVDKVLQSCWNGRENDSAECERGETLLKVDKCKYLCNS